MLEEVGIEVRDYPEALPIFAARWRHRRRHPRSLPTRHVPRDRQHQRARTYVQHARNPINDVVIGGNNTVFAPNYGSPFVHDLDNGRRYATLADFENFVKLSYQSPWLHHSGGTVCEPVDVPVSKRHLDMVYAHLKYSDKPFMGSVTAGSRAADSVELARIGFGGDLHDRTVMTSLINASSPLVWDGTMLAAAQCYAEHNQATIITPFILAGAMAPATSAGVAVQTLAEALVGMTFVQLVRPGAPVVFGSFASSMSMQTGAPTFGTPEPAIVLYTVAALARRLGVPFRSGGSLTASKLPDAQAAYESANTLQPTVLGGVNFVLHAAGWLEGGLAIGYEKFVLDCDQLGMMTTFVRGLDASENGLALDALRTNTPGQPLPRHGAHPGQLRDGVLPQRHRRQLQLRAVERGGRPRRSPAGERDLEEGDWPSTSAGARRGGRRGDAGVRRPPQGRTARRVRLTGRTARTAKDIAMPNLHQLIAEARYEVIPMKNVEPQIPHLPAGCAVSVTCSPAKGQQATLDLTARLLDLGYMAVPHLSARMAADAAAVRGWPSSAAPTASPRCSSSPATRPSRPAPTTA